MSMFQFFHNKVSRRTKDSFEKLYKPSVSRRPLRLEPLEDRALLAVTVAEFEAMRDAHPELNLSGSISDYHVIEVTRLTEDNLHNALFLAEKTEGKNLVVFRTSIESNDIALSDKTQQNLTSFGETILVGFGEENLVISGDSHSPMLKLLQNHSLTAGVSFSTIESGKSTSKTDGQSGNSQDDWAENFLKQYPDWIDSIQIDENTGAKNDSTDKEMDLTGQWIVSMTPEASELFPNVASAADYLGQFGITQVTGLGMEGSLLVHIPTGNAAEQEVFLSSLACLESFGINAIISASSSVSDTVNDPEARRLWGLDNINLPEAWEQTRGSEEVVIAVLDSGIDTNHPDLAANIWFNPGEAVNDGIDNDRNGFIDDIVGWNFIGRNNNVYDDNNHGTHVAGTIGAIADNGIGVVGVAPQVKLLPVKVLGANGKGSYDAIISGINYITALKLNGANIKAINASLGGEYNDSSLYNAVANAGRADILLVAAAGNDGWNIDFSSSYPAKYDLDNIISVASIDSNNNMAGNSNYGLTTVDLAAPGVGIFSTLPNNGYGTMSGTSMAAPHVSGAIALAYSLNENLSAAEVKQALLESVTPTASQSGRTVTGGRLDAARLLETIPYNDSLSLNEYRKLREDHPALGLSENMNDYNIIVITDVSETALREAIATAGETRENDLIVVRTTSQNNTITLSGAELSININTDQYGSVILAGLGNEKLTIDADEQSRVFNIRNSEVAFAGLAITGGNVSSGNGGGVSASYSTLAFSKTDVLGNSANNYGGGIYVDVSTLTLSKANIFENTSLTGGGGIYGRFSRVTITDSSVSDNSATQGGSGHGGGIYVGGSSNDVELTIINSVISGNTAYGNSAGGIRTGVTTTIVNSKIISNTIVGNGSGGGIYATPGSSGTLSIIGSTISGNTAYTGGGISTHGAAVITDSVISENFLTSEGISSVGGGIYNNDNLSLVNSLVSGNSASHGAGIYNHSIRGYVSTATITNSTITGNTATTGSGIYNTNQDATSLILNNSIVAGNGHDIRTNSPVQGHNNPGL